MLVSELISKLQQQNPNAQVLIYCWEDFAHPLQILSKAENQGNKALYCKGYSFFEYEKDNPQDYVIIGD